MGRPSKQAQMLAGSLANGRALRGALARRRLRSRASAAPRTTPASSGW